MSYTTVEVEIDHGKITTKEPGKLPESGHGLLTILEPSSSSPKAAAFLEAFEELQRSLQLDQAGVEKWLATIRDARR